MLVKRLAEALRGSTGPPLERAAELIKEILLDWDLGEEPADGVMADDLPPLDALEFVAAMRGRVEQVLLQLAGAINEAPPGRIVPACEHRLSELLAELGTEALTRGIQMRLQAAEAGQTPEQRPQGRWAEKYRLMRAAGDHLPDPSP